MPVEELVAALALGCLASELWSGLGLAALVCCHSIQTWKISSAWEVWIAWQAAGAGPGPALEPALGAAPGAESELAALASLESVFWWSDSPPVASGQVSSSKLPALDWLRSRSC